MDYQNLEVKSSRTPCMDCGDNAPILNQERLPETTQCPHCGQWTVRLETPCRGRCSRCGFMVPLGCGE